MRRIIAGSAIAGLSVSGCGILASDSGTGIDCGTAPAAVTHLPEVGGTSPGNVFSKPIPQYGRYNFAATDYYAVDCGRVRGMLDDVTARTGVPVRVVTRVDDVRGQDTAMQIIPNLRVEDVERLAGRPSGEPGTSLFTVYLPPGWTRQASMPMLLWGTGYTQSNNIILTTLWWPVEVAMSTSGGRRGLIGAVSNTGGMEGLGVHDSALHDVGRFLVAMGDLGGDPQSVVTAGASRGGLLSFVWAANRFSYDYRVIAAIADVPASSVGATFDLPVQLYPGLLGVFDVIWGSEGWKQSDDPNVKAAALEVLTGHRTASAADTQRLPPGYLADPIYDPRWDALQAVIIGAGSHDDWIPLSSTLDLDRRLAALNVPRVTYLAMGAGHQGGASAATRREAERLLNHLLTPGSGPYALSEPGRRYLLEQDLATHDPARQTLLAVSVLPLTAAFPYAIQVNQPAGLVICGPPGRSWEAVFALENGPETGRWSGTFDAVSECAQRTFSGPPAVGTYTWRFWLDGVEQPSHNTPCLDGAGRPLLAATRVLDHKPTRQESRAPGCGVGFGVDQFHAVNGPTR